MTEKQIEPESDDARASYAEDAKQRREALEENALNGDAGRNRGDALTLNRQEEHEYDI